MGLTESCLQIKEIAPGLYINVSKISSINVIEWKGSKNFYEVKIYINNVQITSNNCEDFRFKTNEEAKTFIDKIIK